MAHCGDAGETRTLHPLSLPARVSDAGGAELRRGLYVDCETTGFSPGHDAVIELASRSGTTTCSRSTPGCCTSTSGNTAGSRSRGSTARRSRPGASGVDRESPLGATRTRRGWGRTDRLLSHLPSARRIVAKECGRPTAHAPRGSAARAAQGPGDRKAPPDRMKNSATCQWTSSGDERTNT